MDKKVNTKFWSLVNAIEPGVKKNITWSDAWEKLATWGGFEGGLEAKTDGTTWTTLMDIWIGNQKIKVLTINNGWNEKEMDFNYNEVFEQSLNYIFDEGLIKKPRMCRKDAKKQTVRKAVINEAKTAQISKETDKMTKYIAEQKKIENNKVFEAQWYSEKNLADMRKRLSNISVKKCDWKKKGKDVSELDKMMEDFRNKIKDIKNHLK